MKKYLVLCMYILLGCAGFSQSPPNVTADPAWDPVAGLSDEFNDSIVSDKWTYAPPWGNVHGDPATSLACLTNASANRKEEGGVLKLKVTQESMTCYEWDGTPHTLPYRSGAIYSVDTIKYGYFEAKIRIPHTSTNNEGYGPNFWFWKLHSPLYGKWSEIDICEIDAQDNQHTCNVHYESSYVSPVSSHWALRTDATYDLYPNFNGQWHVFSCEWAPTFIRFFIDGVLIRETTTGFSDDLLYMNMIFDINVPAVNFSRFSIPGGAATSYLYEIDYVRTYQLQMDCNTVLSNYCTVVSSYFDEVKKSITFSDACVLETPAGYNSFRATDFILIQKNFTVPVGSEALFEIRGCY